MSSKSSKSGSSKSGSSKNAVADISETEIVEKLKKNFTAISEDNLKSIAHYLYLNPKQWNSSSTDEQFTKEVNDVLLWALAYKVFPAIIIAAIIVMILIILLIWGGWWLINTIFFKKNSKNLLRDPSVTNTTNF